MKKIIAVCAFVIFSSVASAQSSNFEGLSIGVGLSYAQPKIMESDDTGNTPYTWNKADTVPQLNFAYNFALNNKWLLGVGGSYDLSKLNAGTTQGSSGLVKATLDEHSSFYLQPTFTLTEKSAIYAKVASHEVKVETVGAGWITDRFRTRGLGYGLGYTRFLGKNVFVQGEVQVVNYQDTRFEVSGTKVLYKLPEENIAQITLGYKF